MLYSITERLKIGVTMIECEVKLKITNPEHIKKMLISLGFIEKEILTETDTYYDTPNGDIRLNDRALRIRETVNHSLNTKQCTINFKDKKLDTISMSRPEYEDEIGDASTINKILECLGYSPVSPQVIKKRLVLRASSINACIDSVEGLGDFLELEAIVANEGKKISELERIEGILSELGYSLSDTTTISYLSALQNLL